ncbi:MAG: hypothetical protein JXR87_03760 [Candidatus Marinimicrobia bacterium]|nr:hypothetical protein [Candidatus Neomarinimicrobiota bacterium]
MFSNKLINLLRRFGWTVFFIILGLETVNLVYREKTNLQRTQLPFELQDSVAMNFSQAGLESLFAEKIITKLDTISLRYNVSSSIKSTQESESSPVVMYRRDKSFTLSIDNEQKPRSAYDEWQDGLENQIDEYIQGKTHVILEVNDSLTGEVSQVPINTIVKINTDELYQVSIIILILIFTFFNSYLLLRYSQSSENILIVYFLIFLVTPSIKYLPVEMLSDVWSKLISPFWGIFFYHFVAVKLTEKPDVKKLYVRSAIIYLMVFFLGFHKLGDLFEIVLYAWPAYWLLKAILLLRKEFRASQKIEYRRLLSAFKGISISGIGTAVVFGSALLLITVLPGAHFLIHSEMLSNILGLVFGLSAVAGVLIVCIGVLWFFGSFTWSLLTGTALDVKIRSTLIYTIVGIVFVTVFGLIDYSLGELLQYLFGKFVGSEFIAGIPGTIVLISLFVPIRNKVERIVDNKLNTSELDFLERAETFTKNLTNEGVVEGFEEYICENLIEQLPIEKVALISYDSELAEYRFNEIRGSDVIENSRVRDSLNLLKGTLVYQSNEMTTDDLQDISSFPLIIPIIFEDEHKWFLALGKKKDNSIYNKNDLASFEKLVDKIKLSLKFILVYEDLVNGKYEQTIQEKDEIIRKLREELSKIKTVKETLDNPLQM